MTLLDIQIKIDKLHEDRRKLLKQTMNGRTQKWLSEQTGIKPVRLNCIIKSTFEFSPDEIKKINNAFSK
jgi:hypothetical protein